MSNKKLAIPESNLFDKIIAFLFALLFFFVPLAMNTLTSEVFEFNKILLTYTIAILIFLTWACKTISQSQFTIKRSPLDLVFLIFFIIQLLSTIFSIDSHTSLWGYYSRWHGGLVSTITYLFLFYAYISNIKDSKYRLYHLYSILGSAIIVSGYGILEHFGIDKDIWVQDVQNRVFSTLGQPNWLGAYLVALLPIPLFLAKTNKKRSISISFYLMAILFFITILFTKSRSAIGTTFIILIISLVTLFRQQKKLLTIFSLTIMILIALTGTPWTPSPSQFAKTLDVGGPLLPSFEKTLNKVHLSSQLKPVQIDKLNTLEKTQVETEAQGKRFGGSDSFEIRKVVWQGALKLGLEHPFLGTGPETFAYSYYTVRPAAHNMLSEWDYLYNKAHNEYLNFLANTGFLGLLSYLVLITAITLLLFKNRQKSLLATPFLLGFISILITNYYGFSVVIIALFVFLFPALITEPEQEQLTIIKLPQHKIIFTIITLIITFNLFKIPLNQLRADLSYNKGKTLANGEQLKDALNYLQAAVNISPNEPLFLAQLADAQSVAAASIYQRLQSLTQPKDQAVKNQGQALLTDYRNLAEKNINQAISINKANPNLYKTQAKIYLYLAITDPKFYPIALQALLNAKDLSPTDAKLYFTIGQLYDQIGDKSKSQTYLQKAIELKPDYTQAQNFLNNLD